MRVQIHFKDPRNKKIDIIHNLKVRLKGAEGEDPTSPEMLVPRGLCAIRREIMIATCSKWP